MDIIFSKKDHRYNKGDIVYTSVSKKIGLYKNDFDREHWSTYKALEELIPDFKSKMKEYGYSNSYYAIAQLSMQVDSNTLTSKIDEITAGWDKETEKSINKGNLYHSAKENLSYHNGFEINPFDKKKYKITIPKSSNNDRASLITNLYELEDGYYPELIIWNDKSRTAGQADKVFIETVNGDRYVDIDDYKTSKKIKTKSFKNQKMKTPLGNLMDCNYVHYNLQISFYAWMLEQFGFIPRNLSFHHFNQMYKLDYLKSDIEKIA